MESEPELARVVAAWATLPGAVKTGIVAMVFAHRLRPDAQHLQPLATLLHDPVTLPRLDNRLSGFHSVDGPTRGRHDRAIVAPTLRAGMWTGESPRGAWGLRFAAPFAAGR